MQQLRLAALGVAVLAILTGCSAQAASTPSARPAASSSNAAVATSVTATPTGTPTPDPTASAGSSLSTAAAAVTDPNRPAGQCADSVLKVALSMPKGAAGSFIQDLVFTNTGSSSCVLRGAPGLSVVGDGNGTQLGAAATRDQAGAKDIRLAAHGGQAYARFGGPELEPGTEGAKHCAGGTRPGDGYRVYPPHSTRAFFVRDADAVACPTGGAFLHVAVVLPEGTAG